MPNNNKRKTIAEHVFNGSTTMAGVSVTIIALFRVMKMGVGTYADEILSANTCIFFASAILAYMALRKDQYDTIETIADILFFTGMVIMMIVGVIIVYTTY
ncbi:MAG TPA: hypothetical protein VN958_10395 [Chitinophagaceae bacterium]|nr:hypothetical protein [Chitinophagaceae bacterium]